MKKFFGEFKKFITRGNVVDLAVGVIIGSAFTAIVTALTNNVFKPLINFIIFKLLGSENLSDVYYVLIPVEVTKWRGQWRCVAVRRPKAYNPFRRCECYMHPAVS